MAWRRSVYFIHRYLSSSAPETPPPTLYSFLQPTIFAITNTTPPPTTTASTPPQRQQQSLLTQDHIATLESTLHRSLLADDTDEAWKSFKSLTSSSTFPSKSLTNSLIAHLSSLPDTHNLKRAFASAVFCIRNNPRLLDFDTLHSLLASMNRANAAAPAFSLLNCMLTHRFFMPFSLWGPILVDISRKNGSLLAFLRVFRECCRIAVDEKLEFMKPDVAACNAALEASCRELESLAEAETVIQTMAVLGVRPDELSFGFLAYLYALKGRNDKILELKDLVARFGFSNTPILSANLISGYVKSGNLESVSEVILCCLREANGEDLNLSEQTYCEVVNGFLKDGCFKGLANLIIEAQKLEPATIKADKSIGFCVINACVDLGFSDKAHAVLDQMDAQGGAVGLGVYIPILKAYCKEYRTAEATQLVMEISNAGLRLDAGTYDELIEASMTSQDFQSAFTLFRDMREARILDLKGSYLTIMTGLMENQRPELMAAFLDEVVEDPRVEVKTHDWNSIIHAFCKAGRLEDAKRTFRRMIFLQFEPNDQTYLSLINGYVTGEKYFSVLMLWNEVRRKISTDCGQGIKFDHNLVDAFLYALVKGGFFDAVMQVVEKSQEMKIFVDKWRYKQAFMETHKKLKISKLRKRSFRKMEALIAFKNWAGLNAGGDLWLFAVLPTFYSVIQKCMIILVVVVVVVVNNIVFTVYGAADQMKGSSCHDTCGAVAVKYPFGSGYGCGHPQFGRYVRCNAHSSTLELSTSTGVYNITSIDYTTSTLIVSDPLMSTCNSMQNSGSFSLQDRPATTPFTLSGDNIFVLLGCSTTSPLFDPDYGEYGGFCDTRGSRSRVCRGMYSCKGVTGIGLPQNAPPSTCCVYDQQQYSSSAIQLAPYMILDLPKLQCSSYTSIYSFGGSQGDPMKWRFGISLQYNASSYPSPRCNDCETSGGFCGFNAGGGLDDQSFACVCRNGKNTTTTCFG
ncbi:hypothetical protein Tsubulata_020532, partial [Turnera subulata]